MSGGEDERRDVTDHLGRRPGRAKLLGGEPGARLLVGGAARPIDRVMKPDRKLQRRRSRILLSTN